MEVEREECSVRVEKEAYVRSMETSAQSVEWRISNSSDLRRSDISLAMETAVALVPTSDLQSDLHSQVRGRDCVPQCYSFSANCLQHNLRDCMEREVLGSWVVLATSRREAAWSATAMTERSLADCRRTEPREVIEVRMKHSGGLRTLAAEEQVGGC